MARFKQTIIHREACKAQGKRLRALRHDTGLSLREIGNSTGINKSTLGKAERGQAFLRQPELMNLAAMYAVSMQYLISGGQLRRVLRTPIQTVTG